jgi:metal-responsive CopG/Arc/MetJ family transcriptional regulator
MKTIHVTFDDRLLRQLDADPEVKRHGRSLVLRKAVFDYLRRMRRSEITEAYRKAYCGKGAPEFDGWADEGVWPEL